MAERTGMNLLAVATGGCWGWRGRIGKVQNSHGERVNNHRPVTDLNFFDGRRAFVLLDANAATNRRKVQQARAAFVRQLTKRNCEVLTCNLPITDGVNGPDDYIAVCGDEAMMQVFADASAGASTAATPNVATRNGLKLVGLGDLLSQPVVPVDYLLAGRLVAGTVSIITSKPKCGKSTFARNFALAVAQGREFFWLARQARRGFLFGLGGTFGGCDC